MKSLIPYLRTCLPSLLAAGAFLLPGTALQAAGLPHLVVFISDDLGRLETSIHGSPDVLTPHLDQLASTGMTFDNAYVASPSCCPNRFSFLTGLMPARHGAHPNHSDVKPGTRFLPPLLQKLGYRVLSFGKVAHGRKGFPGADHVSPPPRDLADHVDAYFAAHPVQGPICLMVGDRRPHVPWTKDLGYDPDRVTLPPYFIDTPETRRHWARYLTDITGMDAEMGRVFSIARERLGENILFLFTSDHGGQWPFGKWNLYDSGTRIPLVISWQSHIQAGVRTDAMVSWVDLLPTLIDLAEGKVPEGIDGRSFAPVLLGKAKSHRDRIFTTHTGDGVMNIYPMRSVRSGNWKYIWNLRSDAWHTNHSDRLRKDGAGAYWDSWDAAAAGDERSAGIVRRYYTRLEEELFDLSADPLEQVNLANRSGHRERLESLREQLNAWARKQGDDLQSHRDPYPRSEPLPELDRR